MVCWRKCVLTPSCAIVAMKIPRCKVCYFESTEFVVVASACDRVMSNYCGRNCTTKQGMEDEDVFNDFKPVIYRINVPLVTLIPLSSSVCDQKKKKAISVTWGKAVPLSVPNWLLLRTLPIPVIMFWNWRQGRWYHGVDCRVIQHIQGVKRCRIWAAR